MSKELPPGWEETTLPAVAVLNMGQSPPSDTYNTEGKGLPFFQGKTEFGDIYPVRVKFCSTPVKIAETDDILISVRAPVGPTNLCRERSCIGRGLAAIRPIGDISSRYLLYFLRSIEGWLSQQGTGSTFTAISKTDLENIEVRVAPLAEQQRIVAKLEVLLGKVDACRKRLEKIPVILKRFRQSVLAAACSGRLTADWREEHPLVIPAAETMARVEALRKAHVSSANKRAEANRYRYKKAALIDLGNTSKGIDDLFELPLTWTWASLGQLTWSVADGPHFSPKYVEKDEGVPFISGRNVSYQGVDFTDAKFVSRQDHEVFSRRAMPSAGDVLLTKGGTTGIAAVVTGHMEFSVWVHVAVLKVVAELVTPFYLRDVLSAPFVYIQSQAQTHGVGNQDLGLTRMVHMALPVPPLPEQHEIVHRVEALFALADQIETRYAKAKTHVDRLTQSILAKAFRGDLVPQDPSDEPASVLLERIRSQRQKAGAPRRQPRSTNVPL